MQLMAQEAGPMDTAKERIEAIAHQKDVLVSEGHGPAFDAPSTSESSLLEDPIE